MAQVTMCDLCGNIVDHKDAIFLAAYNSTDRGTLGNKLHSVDLCTECYLKISRILNNRSTQNDN